jgi:hypothetical protein
MDFSAQDAPVDHVLRDKSLGSRDVLKDESL